MSSPGASYGATPDRVERLGRTVDRDRAWCNAAGGSLVGVHGDFGLAAQVDYYQVQIAKWTAGDMTAWQADSTHVPPDASFAPVTPSALGAFTRLYAELVSSGFW